MSQTSHLYDIYDGFAPKDLYWKQQAQIRRFEGSFKRGILYCPEIVQEMVTEVKRVLNKELPCGVLVRGPQGIGKLHSLGNLVCKLLYNSKGKYLSAFIQDCENFMDVFGLYESICNSFGTSTEELRFQFTSPANTAYIERFYFGSFVAAIELFLEKEDKQWVLIFDLINRLFI